MLQAERAGDGVPRPLGQASAPVTVSRPQGRQDLDPHHQVRVPEHPQQVGQQGVVVDVGDREIGLGAVAPPIADGHGLDAQARLLGDGQEPRMETTHLAAVAGGPLGEDQHPAPGGDTGGDLLGDDPDLIGATLDEEGPGEVGHPAHQWPAPHLGLGEEGDLGLGAQRRDVQPGDVIGHQQTAFGEGP